MARSLSPSAQGACSRPGHRAAHPRAPLSPACARPTRRGLGAAHHREIYQCALRATRTLGLTRPEGVRNCATRPWPTIAPLGLSQGAAPATVSLAVSAVKASRQAGGPPQPRGGGNS